MSTAIEVLDEALKEYHHTLQTLQTLIEKDANREFSNVGTALSTAQHIGILGVEYNNTLIAIEALDTVKVKLEEAAGMRVVSSRYGMSAIEACFVTLANHIMPDWEFIASDEDGYVCAHHSNAVKLETEWHGKGSTGIGFLRPGEVDWETWRIKRLTVSEEPHVESN